MTPLLREGENEALVIMGDGWYRSCSGVDGDRNLYGEDVALWFQLEADGTLRYHVVIPVNATAKVALPVGRICELDPVEHNL